MQKSNRWLTALGGATLGAGLFLTGPAAMAASPTSILAAHHPAMRQILQYGDQGHWVRTLQADLNQLGYQQTGPADGIFGPRTLSGVVAFQKHYGLVASGITNEATWQDILAGLGLVPPYPHSSSVNVSVTTDSLVTSGSGTAPPTKTVSTSPSDRDTDSKAASPAPSIVTQNPKAPITSSTSVSHKMIDGRPVIAVYHMRATAYGPSLQDNYPYGPTDAFGAPLAPGMVAVDPSVIPLKSYVYVTGYTDPRLPQGGFLGHAMDTGGAIKGQRIDIFMNAGAQTVSNFGIEPVTVYLLGP